MATLLDRVARGGIIGKRFLPYEPPEHPDSWLIPEGQDMPYEILSLSTSTHAWYVPINMKVRAINGKKKNYLFDRHLADKELTEEQWEALKNMPKKTKEKSKPFILKAS